MTTPIASISVSEIRLMLSLLCYHDDLQRANNPEYPDSAFEENTKYSIRRLEGLLERMTDSGRPDFIGYEI